MEDEPMDVMHTRVAGLDVHKAMIVACVRVMENGRVQRECRTFDTTTSELEQLLAWLKAEGRTQVAMEATGVYWKPVWNILSDGPFELIVANAAHIKNVPGRKTDMNDAMWIADLVSCGLIKTSFIPEEEIQELRSLLRERKQLTNEQTRYVQRMHKTLEEANIKLDSVISDIMGVSGRRMIEAMIAGVRDAQQLAGLANRKIKASAQELRKAPHGRITEHHRFMLKLRLGQYDACNQAIGQIDQQVDAAITRMDQNTRRSPRWPPLSCLDRTVVHRPRYWSLGGDDHSGGDRVRHEPLPDRRASAGLGRPVPRSERERRQAQVDPHAQRQCLAQDPVGPMRLGRYPQEQQLLQGAIPAITGPPWSEESNLRRRRLDADGDLPPAQRRN
jgi:transposase